MIGYLQGTLILKYPNYIILETNGVGYKVEIPLSTFSELPSLGERINLHIHTYLKENVIKLFGFFSLTEKEAFTSLIEISGVGPRLALNILSCISPEGLQMTIQTEDVTRLKTVPGVGRKTAQRILLEMKDKWKGISILGKTQTKDEKREQLIKDAISALTNLGYQIKEAKNAVNQAWEKLNDYSLEELIKQSLRFL